MENWENVIIKKLKNVCERENFSLNFPWKYELGENASKRKEKWRDVKECEGKWVKKQLGFAERDKQE